MQGDKVHILSTGDIPAFSNHSSKIILDILSFQEIKYKDNITLRQQVNTLAGLPYFAIFTSTNAVKAVAGLLDNLKKTIEINEPAGLLHTRNPQWKCFCVGEKTKESLQKSMPDCTVLATADVAGELSKEIIAARPSPLVFFSGNLRREELPLALNSGKISFEELVVYETVYTAIPIEQKYQGILFFSPGAVNAYFKANKPDPETVLFAIGPTTESALHRQTKNKVLTTDRPDKAALANMALQYFEAY